MHEVPKGIVRVKIRRPWAQTSLWLELAWKRPQARNARICSRSSEESCFESEDCLNLDERIRREHAYPESCTSMSAGIVENNSE